MELGVRKWTSLPCCDPPWHLCGDPAPHLLIRVCLVRLIQRTREMILDYYSCRKVALNLIVEKLHTYSGFSPCAAHYFLLNQIILTLLSLSCNFLSIH